MVGTERGRKSNTICTFIWAFPLKFVELLVFGAWPVEANKTIQSKELSVLITTKLSTSS